MPSIHMNHDPQVCRLSGTANRPPTMFIYLFLLLPIASSFSTERLHTLQSSRVADERGCCRTSFLQATAKTAPKRRQSASTSSVQTMSDDLLNLLKQKTSGKHAGAYLDDEINSLVKTLIASKSTFDPFDSINGPLFASVHFIGETPLWEKIAIGNVQNIKGQRYTAADDTSGSFVNYAEIFGESLYLKATGKFIEKGAVIADENAKTSNNPLDLFSSFFSSPGRSQNKQTPFDYEAIVTGASIVIFGKPFDVTIEGTGTVRVLYADPNLRIFLSPTNTDVTRGAGDWESAGLIVVQVRIDLLYNDWSGQTLET